MASLKDTDLGPDPATLRTIFADFNGAVAPVTESPGKPFPVLDVTGAQPLVEAMQAVAAKHDLSLALLWPGKDHEDGFNPRRANAYLEKTARDTWRVTRFDIG